MRTQFTLDLRLARRKAGYTQADLAHLLSARQATVSDLEQGRSQPNLEQIVELSLIYGRSFESFFAEIMAGCRTRLTSRLESLPEPTDASPTAVARSRALKRLRARLLTPPEDGA
ncbi:MAG: helix-turn-helix transcriptional regulator [Pseudomonadota bacterium]